ncbi:scavenger receptor cysteine-rich domain-containing group B protein-like [Paramisgurnus dabryanus]|uniref:scavenger receptor cysteine-rich domain-containing group B protein-like n=1 Tax=Paramisgurnus dabryanus TaxID=90735 RepID=UPI0031F41494
MDIRLVNGANRCSGRVEVLYNDQWGTVCDAGWDLADAAVVCSSMGCGTPIAAKTGPFFGQGSGPVWLDDVSCSGNEPSVKNCPSKALGTSTCSHGQDAGVVCRVVNLVDGSSPCDGRVQVLYDDWGGVCHSGWGLEEAVVVCEELGCGDTGELQSYVGPFVGPIWMDNLACTGKELTLRNCPFTGSGATSCVNDLYAGVTCIKLVRRGVVRIVFTATTGFDINDPINSRMLLNKIQKVVQSKGDYNVNWKTQSDGQIFHKQMNSYRQPQPCES